MYSIMQKIDNKLKMNPRFVESLKRRAMRRELTEEFTLGLEDISAACMLEDFKNDETLLIADRIAKKLGKIHAKKAMESRTISMPSKQFVSTYLSSFMECTIMNSIRNEVPTRDRHLQGFAQARLLLSKQKFEDVMPACTEEIECNGNNKVEALLLRATLYLVMGDYKNAFLDCSAVIEVEDVDKKLKVNALIKRASCRQQLHEPEKSIGDFNQAIALDPTNADIFYHRGQYYLQMQNITKAMDDYKKSVSLNPNFPFACMQKSYAEYRWVCITHREEKMQEVLKDFEQGLKKFPKCAEYYSLFAQILCDREEYERANTYFNKALEIERNNATLYVHKGVLELEWKDDADQAVQLISEALKIDPYCEFAYETLATIEVQRGDLKSAVELFDKAISLAKSEMELEHLYSLRNVAVAQVKASEKLDILLVSDAED